MSEDKILQKLDSIDIKLDNHAKKLIEHDEEFLVIRENMATKSGIERLSNNQEQMITILKRLDEDRVFTHAWVSRLEKDVEDTKVKTQEHEVEIKKMKTQLNIA